MPLRKKTSDSAHYGGLLSSKKPISNSVYLSIAVFDHEHQVLLSPNKQLPTLPIFTRDRLAYRALTLNSANFHSIIHWSQQLDTTSALAFIEQLPQQQRSFLNRVANVHAKLIQLIGGDLRNGSLYRHIVEFNRPNFKLLVMMYPFEKMSFLPPLSRTSHLCWHPSTSLNIMSTTPSTTPTTNLWRQPRSIHNAHTAQLAPGLYLALFYCQSSPPNNQQGLQIFLEKHCEHHLPCVPLRSDTRISNVEWEWLQSLGRHSQHQGLDGTTLDDYDQENGAHKETLDFLTEEMQQHRRQQQLETQRQLAPFQQALEQGRSQLQGMAGVPIQLKDLFTEDSLCLMYENGDSKYNTGTNDTDSKKQQQTVMDDSHDNTDAGDDDDDDNDDDDNYGDDGDDSTMKTTLNDLDMNSSDDDDSLFSKKLPPPPKKKTLSIADMFTYGQQQTQHAWNRSAHVRMLVIVKPLCVTPDFPVQPNFDFYPYHIFKSLSQDKLQFATDSLLEPPSPRRHAHHQHHRMSMSDLLTNTDHNINTKQPYNSIRQHTRDLDKGNLNTSSDDYNGQVVDRSPPTANSNTTPLSIESFRTTTSHLTPPVSAPSALTTNPSMVCSRMALFYQEKDMKGWAGGLLEFDRQRMVQRQRRESHQHLHCNTTSLSSNGTSVNEEEKTQHYDHQAKFRPRTHSVPITTYNNTTITITTTTATTPPPGHDASSTPPPMSLSKWLKRWWTPQKKSVV